MEKNMKTGGGLVLLIDDDESLRKVTAYNLAAAGHKVLAAASGEEGLALFRGQAPDIIVTDVRLGDMDGLDVLGVVKEEAPEIPVIVITAFGTIQMAVKAMNEGAFTFIPKPFDRETLRNACAKAMELRTLRSRDHVLSEEIDKLTGTSGMITANSAMAELLDTALKAASSEAAVLITGESGTGKELLARLIHQHSPRRERPMVAVNCSAIPKNLIESELFGHVKGAFTGAVASRKGKFQTASRGTLFLDEIGELKVEMQAKLLRALQEQEVEPVGADHPEKVDVRIIAATNKDLREAIQGGEFREDLFYRLSVIPLHLPPLRERKDDIPRLVDHFLGKCGAPPEVRFSERAMSRLVKHRWPGNIRELRNTIERCVILRRGETIDEDEVTLPSFQECRTVDFLEIPDEGLSLEEVEKKLVQKALEKSGGNRSEAARLLKIPRHVLLYRMEKFGCR